MQRYRINYKLLIGLFVGSIVASVTLFFLWRWQLNRKASWYRERSEVAIKEDNKLEAFEYLEKFVKLRTEDNEARVQLAGIAADILEMEGVSREDQIMAYGILDQTVRRTGDPVARRKIADLLVDSGRPQDAITHYEELLKDDPDNAELKALHCRALFRAKDFINATNTAYALIGFDPKTEAFDESKAEAPDQPEIYATVASVLVQRENNYERAKQIIDQMVKVNPESAVAHLERSIYLYSSDKKDEAAAELAQAVQLDPNSSDVLFRQIAVATDEKQFETARDLSTKGIEKYPEEMRYYRLLANSELSLKEYDKSIAAIDLAIKKFPRERSIDFQNLKIDVLLAQKNIDGVKAVLDELQKLGFTQLKPLIEFHNARILFTQERWAEAAQQLQRVRPQLVNYGRMQAIAGTMLGETYDRLGKSDLALQMYNLVINDETIPSDDPAKKIAETRRNQIRQKLGLGGDEVPADDLNALVRKMLALPAEQQDWVKIDAFIDELVTRRGLSEVQKKLLRAQVYSQRQMLNDAKQLIREALQLEPQNVVVKFAATKLMLIDLPDGPKKAWDLLEKIEKDHGVTEDSRTLKAEAVAAMGGPDVKERLRALTDGTEEWTNRQKLSLATTIGIKFMQLADLPSATEYLSQAADLDPQNLPLRVQLFELAFQQQDDAAMREAQKKILDVVKTEQDGNYILTEVKRRLILAEAEQMTRADLVDARRMLDDALTRRPQWHELHVLYGQLLLVLNEDIELALQHLDDALKYGPPNPHAVGLQVKLLAQRGDIKQARERMDRIPKELRGRVLGRSEAAVLAATGEQDASFEAAKAEAERHPNDAATQAWFASLALQVGKLDEAAIAYRKACDLNPLEHDYWMKLVSVFAQQQNADAIENAFRDAQLALDPEFLPLIQAKLFELQGRWKAAEDIYFSIYGTRTDNPALAQRMAAFYATWAVVQPKMAERMFPYINTVLRAANEGKVKVDDPIVDWSRERAALYFLSTGSYQDSLRAERLLKQIATDGDVPPRFQPLYSQILSSRSDPVSILAAIDALSTLNQRGRLSKEDSLLLAKLYGRTNNWKSGKALMLDALSVYPSDPEVWSTYINLLIGQKEYTQAAQRLNRFEEISNNKFEAFQLRTHLAHERGDQAEVKRLLRSMLPPGLNAATPLDETQLNLIRAIAGLAVSFNDYELSEQLLKIYVKRKPEGIGDLVNVMALYGNAEQALPIIKQLAAQAPVQMAQLGVQMLRLRRPELGDKFDEQVADLVASALREDPDAGDRLVTRAEMYEVMEKYDEAIAAYEEVINRDDLAEKPRAAAMNNLAFLLAQLNRRLDDSQKLIDDAIEILGPVADALDTRAVIRMARKEYDLAVEDMTLSLAVDPTAVKHYHMAKAQALVGNAEAANESWKKAQEMKISKEALPLIEQPGFAETEKLIENLKTADAN